VADVEISGINFRIGKLNAFQQFHIVRRIAPLLSGLGETFARAPAPPAAEGEEAPPEADESNPELWSALGPVADALAKMTDADTEYVLKLCLGVCQRQQDGGLWSRVVGPSGQTMFDDIDLGVMMQLVFAVVQENLSGFFSAGRAAVGGSAGATLRSIA
jgi:hypothetical protein